MMRRQRWPLLLFGVASVVWVWKSQKKSPPPQEDVKLTIMQQFGIPPAMSEPPVCYLGASRSGDPSGHKLGLNLLSSGQDPGGGGGGNPGNKSIAVSPCL
ncbi:hypothetical protein HPB47_021452 [Ixodes persulcatus]|uniref:Uncharacterized protein n=1 Tax=Ixodes persulcatus TaxID=34615 RepID=A0AC60QCP5_IXOPE|nr:hypothetical protein HPB47_021452 [Ixodes persulcatus]